MRTIRLLVAGLTIFAVAACATSTPGWTYAPPSASAVPSADAGASAAPSGSAAPSASAAPSPAAAPTPTAAPSPTASVAPSGAPALSASPGASEPAGVVEVSAQNIAFSTTELSVPANLALQINFANNDAGIPHNIAIKDGAGLTLFDGDIFNGVATRTYSVEPLSVGTYQFVCTVHPNMVGTLTAK